MNVAEWTQVMSDSVVRSVQRVGEYLPTLLGAAILMLAGWIVARLLRALVLRGIRKLDWLLGGRAVQGALSRIGVDRPASEMAASIVFWIVMFLTLTAATETLGLPVIATWLGGLSYYLPRVLVGVLIVFAGILAGNLAGEAVRKAAGAAGLAYAEVMGRVAHVVILLIAVVTAVDQVGIDTDFLTATITIVIGTVIGGAGLAFGLWARTHVGNIIAASQIRQAYRVNQVVRIGSVQGKILEITSTAVIVESPEGRVLVPAGEFSEEVSVLVTAGA